MATSRMALITFFEGNGPSPDQSLPGSPTFPSQGLPGWNRPVDPGYGQGGPLYPSQGLPGGGHISLLPVFPFDPTLPDQSLPGSQPGPDNTLPGGSGGSISNELPRPGKKYVVKWLACSGLILVPDNSLPATPEPK